MNQSQVVKQINTQLLEEASKRLDLALANCVRNLTKGTLNECEVRKVSLEKTPVPHVYKVCRRGKGMTIYLGDYTIECGLYQPRMAHLAIAEYSLACYSNSID